MQFQSRPPELAGFLDRLSETIAWCECRSRELEPAVRFRTGHLYPRNRAPGRSREPYRQYSWKECEYNRLVVTEVADRRAELVRNAGRAPISEQLTELPGQLLLFDPNQSDLCVVAVAYSNGFIDEADTPPWDTWICWECESPLLTQEFIDGVKSRRRDFYGPGCSDWEPPRWVEFLISWVPEELVPLVDQAIDVIPTSCAVWAHQYQETVYNTALLRQLDAAGLLQARHR